MAITCPSVKSDKPEDQIQTEIFDAIDELPQHALELIADQKKIHFSYPYLKALEDGGKEVLRQFYAVLTCSEKMLGIIVYQWTVMESDIPSVGKVGNAFVKRFAASNREGNPTIKAGVLTGGNTFGTGEQLLVFTEEISQDKIADILTQLAREVTSKFKLNVDFFMFKDYFEEDLLEDKTLKETGLTLLETEPCMTLHLDPNWKSFEDYLASMKSKFRTKANSAMKRSDELVCKDLTLEDLDQYKDVIDKLYNAVLNRASFRGGILCGEVFYHWKKTYGEDCLCKGYFNGDDLVGFQMGFICGDILDAGFVGFETESIRNWAILNRMLYEFVKWSIDRNCKELIFGRTATELKSTVGAVPSNSWCYVRHRQSTYNKLTRLVLNQIKSKEQVVRKPFKEIEEKA